MNVLDLFSGIGGFSLGLERAGMRTIAFCEIDPFCRQVLAKHWPHVPCYEDVRTLTAERLRADGIAADIICGGFPCQDISSAGAKIGIEGERSGLWSEFARLIGELRPRFAIIENVSALLARGLAPILCDLAVLGFDAEWHCVPAAAVGAPHLRERVWIVAYPHGDSESRQSVDDEVAGVSTAMGHALGASPDTNAAQSPSRETACQSGWWLIEPDVGRVAHGVSARVDRLRSLGNAVVPQIPEIIGRAILAAERIA